MNLRQAMKFYKDLVDNGGLPNNFQEGNGHSMVQYPANGEASDWMLGKLGIFALSPELGSSDKNSDYFFIQNPQELKSTLSQNFNWVKYSILKLMPEV